MSKICQVVHRLLVCMPAVFAVFFSLSLHDIPFGWAAAAPSGRLMIIFDASGSMWGQIDGKAKIGIAKESFAALIRDLPSNLHVGLVAYGHRRKGDCSDVETLVVPGPLDREMLIETVNAINPKGKTPITLAIKKTVGIIKLLKNETSIILVSDGKETCGADPCEFVRQLRRTGLKFVMHVIGFDVDPAGKEQLACMAEAGGGEYYPADSPESFRLAAKKALEKSAQYNLSVTSLRNGKMVAAVVNVYQHGTDRLVDTRQSFERDPARFSLPEGVYELKVIDEWGAAGKPERTIPAVAVFRDSVVEKTVTFGGGTLAVKPLKNGRLFDAVVSVFPSGTKKATASRDSNTNEPARFQLQEGSYDIVVRDEWGTGQSLNAGTIVVKSGETVEKAVVFTDGELHVTTYRNGKMMAAWVSVLENEAGRVVEEKQSYEGEPARFHLLPGSYHLNVKDEWGNGEIREIRDVSVEAGKTAAIAVDFSKP